MAVASVVIGRPRAERQHRSVESGQTSGDQDKGDGDRCRGSGNRLCTVVAGQFHTLPIGKSARDMSLFTPDHAFP
jgi:hypothetical protein